MQQNRQQLGTVLMVAVIAAWVGGWGTPAFAKPARVEVTGQTECFDTSGNPIECSSAAGTGQEGDIQAGVPFPTPRFTDRGNGTVKDNLTNLIWLKNANCSTISPADWATALSNANSLANGQCGLSVAVARQDGDKERRLAEVIRVCCDLPAEGASGQGAPAHGMR